MAHRANLAGATSIGDGIVTAHNALIPVTGYREKAIVVFTAGIENREARISSVLGSIGSRTFAIGLGTETQVDIVIKISQNSSGVTHLNKNNKMW
jgi:hypothetical protein